MAIMVLIIGESGTGKTTSLRNFKSGELSVINVSGKPLPFKNNGIAVVNTDNYNKIAVLLKKASAPSIVVDDAQYLMAFEFMNKAKERGYDKFTDIGSKYFNMLRVANSLPDDKIVYILSHIEQTAEGKEKCKTIGKMLDEKITLEGLFTIVLKTVVTIDNNNQRRFLFSTVNNGYDTVKSPMGMFTESLIDNDLKQVDTTIREFYKNN